MHTLVAQPARGHLVCQRSVICALPTNHHACLAVSLPLPVAGIFEWPYAKYAGKDSENHAVTLTGWGIETLKNGTKAPFWSVSAFEGRSLCWRALLCSKSHCRHDCATELRCPPGTNGAGLCPADVAAAASAAVRCSSC